MESLPHYFIGIPVHGVLKEMFSAWQEDLKAVFPFKRWTLKDDLHITLRFLGPVKENNILKLSKVLKQVEDMESFSLNVGCVGTFGNPKRPRVLFAGVEKTPPLVALYENVETCLGNYGFSKESRAYHPHITLAKKWNHADDNSRGNRKLEYYQQTAVLKVDSVALFQVFPKQKPKYKAIYNYTLRGGVNGTAD